MLNALDHVTIRSTDLERTAVFYEALLGLPRGPRPAFGVPGHWHYGAGHPVLHVLAVQEPSPVAMFDHMAFQARGRAAFEQRLRGAGVAFQQQPLPDGAGLQLFLRDPDGLRLELVFRRKEDF